MQMHWNMQKCLRYIIVVIIIIIIIITIIIICCTFVGLDTKMTWI